MATAWLSDENEAWDFGLEDSSSGDMRNDIFPLEGDSGSGIAFGVMDSFCTYNLATKISRHAFVWIIALQNNNQFNILLQNQ